MRVEVLREADKILRDYDVRDGGWEHEIRGRAFNVAHVQTHLAKGETEYHFTSYDDVSTRIMPDALAYALRLARWNNLSYFSISEAANEAFERVSLDWRKGMLPDTAIAWYRASSVLAANIHDSDHPSSYVDSATKVEDVARSAAGLLILSAERTFPFVLEHERVSVLAARLCSLRERFGITPAQPASE